MQHIGDLLTRPMKTGMIGHQANWTLQITMIGNFNDWKTDVLLVLRAKAAGIRTSFGFSRECQGYGTTSMKTI
jgi:hypothetical protein